ncbi:MAG: hypothetical protein ACYTEZ_17080 [Planctomycetota bacterium]|jgi:hypothetical protein
MDVDRFFAHHGVTQNPFGAEEARHDPVFEKLSLAARRSHPEFAKVLGNIERPHTSVVFGEKGAGKTAFRLLMAKEVERHNAERPDRRTLLVAYDDLNPVLDVVARNRHGIARPSPNALLRGFRREDHQDAILALATTKVMDALLGVGHGEEAMQLPADVRSRLRALPHHLRVDAAVLAALYDQPRSGNLIARWRTVRSRIGLGWRLPFSLLKATALLLTVLALGGLVLAPLVAKWFDVQERLPEWLLPAAGIAAAAAVLFWGAWLLKRLRLWHLCRRIKKETPTLDRSVGQLGVMIGDIRVRDRLHQPWPLPGGDGTNARYELTQKLLSLLGALDYSGMLVLVDRVDEPTLVAGQPDRMRMLIWPLLDSKFLQQEGVGFKLLLPLDLRYLVHKEGSEFYQEARLDKQHLVDRLAWSGATLYDLCTERLRVCHEDGEAAVALTDLFEEDVSRETLVEALGQMSQPRDAFKLLHAVIREHCQRVPTEDAHYRIPRLTLESVRREQTQRVLELHRGLSPA